MKSLLNVGAEKVAILAARQIIMAILNSKVEELTKREALKTLCKVTTVENVTIANCNFSS